MHTRLREESGRVWVSNTGGESISLLDATDAVLRRIPGRARASPIYPERPEI
jgi:hypothetical protein